MTRMLEMVFGRWQYYQRSCVILRLILNRNTVKPRLSDATILLSDLYNKLIILSAMSKVNREIFVGTDWKSWNWGKRSMVWTASVFSPTGNHTQRSSEWRHLSNVREEDECAAVGRRSRGQSRWMELVKSRELKEWSWAWIHWVRVIVGSKWGERFLGAETLLWERRGLFRVSDNLHVDVVFALQIAASLVGGSDGKGEPEKAGHPPLSGAASAATRDELGLVTMVLLPHYK